MNDALVRRWAYSLCVVLGLFWLASRKTFFSDTISSPFLAIAILSIFLILLRTKPTLRELGVVGVLAGCLYLVDIRFLAFRYRWPVIGSFLGMAGFGVLAWRAIWNEGEERKTALLTLIPAFLFVASEWFASYFLEWGEHARSKTLDLYLYSFDASLHIQPAFWMGQWFARLPAFEAASVLVYLALPVAIGLVFAGCVMKDRESAIPSVVTFLITGPIGACFYMIFPALGPVHLFLDKFPWNPLTYDQAKHLVLEALPLAGPRNAIPSLHAAWIFQVFWYARKLSVLERVFAGAFVFFTLCATLGTGEHYLVDLVVALPFTVMVLALTQIACGKGAGATWNAMLYGLAWTLAWFAVLRYGTSTFWASPVIPWTDVAVTLLSGWYFGRRLGSPMVVTEMIPAAASGD